MQKAGSRPDDRRSRLPRWLAPALLLSIAAGLAPLWWEVTAPPSLAVARPWRDPAGTLMVPAAAVRPRGQHGRVEAAGVASLFVVRDGVAVLTRVELGAVRADGVEVRGGLEDAALLVADPPRGLEDRHREIGRASCRERVCLAV